MEGNLYIKPKVDTVISQNTALCGIYGRFLTGAEVNTATEKKLPLFQLHIKDLDYIAAFEHPATMTPSFPEKPSKLSDFLAFLDTHDISDAKLICHEFQPSEDGQVTIKRSEPCAFEPLRVPVNVKSEANSTTYFGSNMNFAKVTWATGEVSDGHCKFLHTFKFETSAQTCQIVPTRPQLYLNESYRFRSGMVYQLF